MFLLGRENEDFFDFDIITKNYSCFVKLITEPIYEIICDISESYIITTVNNLHLSIGTSEKGEEAEEGVFLSIDLKYGLNNGTEIIINAGQIIYRKSSDGLSGGAIVGIIIAVVAIIITISITTIILIKRKTKPSVDNTTIVGMNPDQDKIKPEKNGEDKI